MFQILIFKTLVKLENLDGMDKSYVDFDLKPKENSKEDYEDSSDYDEEEGI